MLIRSRREDIHSKATSVDIGPGSYDPKIPDFKPKHGMAPFSSTTERQTGMVEPFKTPGPGAYDSTLHTPTIPHSKGTSAFASQGTRGSFIPISDTPGPGSYSGEIVKEASHPRASSARKKAKGPQSIADITWVKVATAPSIPARTQNYGYEEGSAGELIQCAPPIAGHSGQLGDQPGPGEYNPHVAAVKANPKATKFTGAASRSDVVPREQQAIPGPGTYNPQLAGKGVGFQGGVASLKTQSMFASTSTRSFLGTTGKDAPGPGAYKPASTFQSMREYLASNPESFHAFGSSGKQPHIQTHDNEGVPGPGSYEPQIKVPAGHVRPLAGSAFVSSTERFKGMHSANVTPGPGGYEAVAGTVTASLRSKLRGRFGVFGSTSARFPHEQPPENAGPASYDPPIDINPSELRRKDRRTSAFRSHSKRAGPGIKPPAKDEGAGTQYYNIQMPWLKGITSPLPRAARFGEKITTDVPGPGQYPAHSKFDVEATAALRHKPTFGHCGRFANDKPSVVPGPGAYNTTPSLLKKTFNITIGDSWE